MPEATDEWVHFSTQPPKRKRAELVCLYCHSKKIKCDIQKQSNEGFSRCSQCIAVDRECEPRESRRGKRRNINSATDRHLEKENSQHRRDRPRSFESQLPPSSAHHVDSDLRTAFTSRSTNSGLPAPPRPPGQTTPSVVPLPRPAPKQAFSTSPGQISDVRSVQLPNTPTSASVGEGVGRSHQNDVDVGYLQVYDQENQLEADMEEMQATFEQRRDFPDPKQQELQQTFAETYWNDCYSWCPILDPATLASEMDSSPMLANAVAIAGSHVCPPLVQHEGPGAYYDKARTIFYNDGEPNSLTMLKALCLFYWWAPKGTSTMHRHSSWWWTSVIIRHAQQMGIHREPAPNHPMRHRLDLSLRRRIWWTVFARERLTALCQSKPCIIDPEDCNISEPRLSDFPPDENSQRKGLIFIHWVKLCTIIGNMAKTLSRSPDCSPMFTRFQLYRSLVEWVQNLPSELRLQIGSARTPLFDKDVHQLHLPYLTAIIILHLRREAQNLPQALTPAILAASCTVRILRDILSRGNARFLMPITCWYSGVAFIPLLQALRVPKLAREADDGINVLVSAVEQLQKMWASANVIRHGIERLRKTNMTESETGPASQTDPLSSRWSSHAEGPTTPFDNDGPYDWTALFPFVTKQTSKIAGELFDNKEQGTFTRGLASPANIVFYESMQDQYHGFFDPFMDFPVDFSDLNFPLQEPGINQL